MVQYYQFMRLLIVCLFGLLPSVQATETHLEVITTNNLDRLQKVKEWKSANGDLVAAEFSPGGSMLALALNDGSVQIIDPITYQVKLIFFNSIRMDRNCCCLMGTVRIDCGT
jgi:hypothetical protein